MLSTGVGGVTGASGVAGGIGVGDEREDSVGRVNDMALQVLLDRRELPVVRQLVFAVVVIGLLQVLALLDDLAQRLERR